MKWDPEVYAQFADFRDRPFHEMVARIGAASPNIVTDLGCGLGNQTVTLTERWPQAAIMGIDSSEEMIARANAIEGYPHVHFKVGDATTFDASVTDVLISNAMLQWIPEHRELLSTWADQMHSGSWLAFQVPGNFEAPSHVLMRELASSPTWKKKLDGVLRGGETVSDPSDYLALLAGAGMVADAWETTYSQVLQGEDPVLGWVRGTALRPVFNALSPEDAEAFVAEYAQLLRDAYPARDFGTVFEFRRIFAVAFKP